MSLSDTHRTVTITTADDPTPRDFHLLATGGRIARFVAKVESQGGTAKVGPYKPGPELLEMLAKVAQHARIPLVTAQEARATLERCKATKADVAMARAMLRVGRLTDEARAYVAGAYPQFAQIRNLRD